MSGSGRLCRRLLLLLLLFLGASWWAGCAATGARQGPPRADSSGGDSVDVDEQLDASVPDDDDLDGERRQRAFEGEPSPADETHNFGKFVRFELVTTQPRIAAAFYGALFGWTFVDADDDTDAVLTIENDGRFLGRIRRFDKTRRLPMGWVSWISVENLDDVMRDIESNGGRILERPRRVHTERRALLRGPTGGTFGLVHADDGDGPDRQPAHGFWIWSQLWSREFNTASTFYTLLGGYTSIDYRFQSTRYRVLESDGRVRAIIVTPPPGQASRWLPVVQVDSVDAIVEKATGLNGQVITRPRTVEGIGRVATLRSPAGGIFGVVAPAARP